MRQILSFSEPPGRTATAFAVGIFIGMSPLLGVHTVLGLFVATLLRLNRIVTLAGVYVTNPWTIVPIYSFGTWFGAKIIGMDNIIPKIDWSHITLLGFFREFRPLLLPFIIGTTLVGIISSIISYYLIYKAAKNFRG